MYVGMYVCIYIYIYIHDWLVVWNMFSIFWEQSSQLTNIFQRGWNHQPDDIMIVAVYIYKYIYIHDITMVQLTCIHKHVYYIILHPLRPGRLGLSCVLRSSFGSEVRRTTCTGWGWMKSWRGNRQNFNIPWFWRENTHTHNQVPWFIMMFPLK